MVATASATESRCWTLQGADDVDAGVPDDLHVLPALLARRAGHVRVGQLVDERHGGLAGEDGVRVHLLDDDAAVLDAAAGHDLESLEQRAVRGSAVRLHEARRRRRCPGRRGGGPPRACGRSCRRRVPCPGRRAADPGRRPAPRAGAPASPRPSAARRRHRAQGGSWQASSMAGSSEVRQQPVEVEVELQDVDARLVQEAEQRRLRVLGHERAHLASAPCPGRPRPARPGTRPPPG